MGHKLLDKNGARKKKGTSGENKGTHEVCIRSWEYKQEEGQKSSTSKEVVGKLGREGTNNTVKRVKGSERSQRVEEKQQKKT